MNKQRKVVITTTYNEMGIIIDTKAEEVTQPNLQPTCNRLATDCISRQAAIDALQKCRKHCIDPFDSYHIDIQDAENQLSKLPTIQPEPHEGYWIDKGWNGDWAWQIDGRGNCWRVIECSECGKRVLVESNYCPHCGAKMTISTK